MSNAGANDEGAPATANAAEDEARLEAAILAAAGTRKPNELLSELQRECWALREHLTKLGGSSGERVLVRAGSVKHNDLVKEYASLVTKWRIIKDMVGTSPEGDKKEEWNAWLATLRTTLKEAQGKVTSLRGSAVLIEDHFIPAGLTGSTDSLSGPHVSEGGVHPRARSDTAPSVSAAGDMVYNTAGWIYGSAKTLVSSYFYDEGTSGSHKAAAAPGTRSSSDGRADGAEPRESPPSGAGHEQRKSLFDGLSLGALGFGGLNIGSSVPGSASSEAINVDGARGSGPKVGDRLPRSDGGVDVAIQRCNWYHRWQHRVMRFQNEEVFVRVDPDLDVVRGVYYYEDVQEISQSSAGGDGVYLRITFGPPSTDHQHHAHHEGPAGALADAAAHAAAAMGAGLSELWLVAPGDAQRVIDVMTRNSSKKIAVKVDKADSAVTYRHVPGYIETLTDDDPLPYTGGQSPPAPPAPVLDNNVADMRGEVQDSD